MRTPFIAGNWKMHKTPEESIKLAKEIDDFLRENLYIDVDVLVCPPYTSLYLLNKELKDRKILLGAQNMSYEEEGAYTGEISPLMLKEMDIEYVILGHSERRQIFNENDEIINKKVKKAIEHNLKPILCVGETLEERESGKEKDKVKNQILTDLEGIEVKKASDLTIAYEPIWAIGTGKTASSDDANDMIKYIRSILKELYNEETAEAIRIQYGGSVKPHNIKELMNKSDIDGALVGGASLKSEDFNKIIDF
ncbi:MAG: triose-phosphate isomerase [Bacillota bacterium]|nr:triose-phosphate isomerase [Bacillota bacterium]